MSPERRSRSSVITQHEVLIPASKSMINVAEGVVHSQHVGLADITVRIRVGQHVDLRVKLAIDDERRFVIGQSVIAKIPSDAIRFEAGLFRRSRQRLNRWYGRIVLLKPLSEGHLITIKLHGEGWTLTSTMPVVRSAHRPQTWDSVNIVVDPQAIELVTDPEAALLKPTVRCHKGFVYT